MNRSISGHIEAHRPDSSGLHCFDSSREATDEGHGQVLDRTRSSLCDRRRDMNGAMLGQNHARHSSALGNSQKRPEIARVGDSVYG
jgi:hypothetical protein